MRQRRRDAIIIAHKAPCRNSDGSRFSLPLVELLTSGFIGVVIGVALIVGTGHLQAEVSAGGWKQGSFSPVAAPIPILQPGKGSLVLATIPPRPEAKDDFLHFTQTVKRDQKQDMLQRPALTDDSRLARAAADDRGAADALPATAAPRREEVALVRTPPVWKLERSWRLAKAQRMRILAARKKRLRERMCLAKALYFEARGESMKGQLAVAQVILNRVRDPRFPNTVCGVVYQGAERRNACQFSFACDGRPDRPSNARQWAIARRLAARALSGKTKVRGMRGVAFYHADYVRPQWASVMRPVLKIGRHIFYRDS